MPRIGTGAYFLNLRYPQISVITVISVMTEMTVMTEIVSNETNVRRKKLSHI